MFPHWFLLYLYDLSIDISGMVKSLTIILPISPFVWSYLLYVFIYALVAQTVKNTRAMQETKIQSLGWKDPLENGMATHSIFLPGKFHRKRCLVGYCTWGHKESDMTEQQTLHFLHMLGAYIYLQLSYLHIFMFCHYVMTFLEKVCFHFNPKKGNAKECSNYCTIALISHASKVMFKILQARFQQ